MTLNRALELDTGAKRAEALLHAIAIERRQAQAVVEAQGMIDAKDPVAAQRLIIEALKDNRRYAPLITLRRS